MRGSLKHYSCSLLALLQYKAELPEGTRENLCKCRKPCHILLHLDKTESSSNASEPSDDISELISWTSDPQSTKLPLKSKIRLFYGDQPTYAPMSNLFLGFWSLPGVFTILLFSSCWKILWGQRSGVTSTPNMVSLVHKQKLGKYFLN